ncbi:MAG TPA: hypothetical protein VFR07_18710 [Mycobacteriales bacterium]|jgi:hypothetical protein|nr:hypothetical protein [Mycobacteriales bacterium]
MTQPTARTLTGGAAHVRVVRRIAADPTSTALLLAGPAAVELWPGVHRVGELDGRTLVEVDPEVEVGTRATASVTAFAPQRTPTAFVSRFAWSGPDLPATTATLTLTYAPRVGGVVATAAVLQLDSTGPAGSRVDHAGLTRMAERFLSNLARAAEQRAYAA